MKSLLTTLVLLLPPHSSAPSLQAAAQGPDAVAVAALERATRFQRGETPLPRPSTFHGRFTVTVRDRDGSNLGAEVERFYSRDPERMLTRRRDTLVDSDSSVGFDGHVAWFQDHVSGTVRRYTDDPVTFETDLAQLDEQLELMPILLDAVVLDALVPRLLSPRLAGRTELRDQQREQHTVEIVTAEAVDELFAPDPDAPPPEPGDPPPRLAVQLGIDAETGALWSFRLETLGRERPRILELRFDHHLPTRQGLRVPANIKIYEDGATGTEWSANLGVIPETIEGRAGDFAIFEIDPPLEPGLFAVPE